MHLIFITNKYPNQIDENGTVFLQQLVNAIAKRGEHCSVICPVPINLNPGYLRLPEKTEEYFGDCSVAVYYPRYIGFGQTTHLGFNPARITTRFFTAAVQKTVRRYEKTADILYGHFVTPAGIAAARVGRKYRIPSFLAFGEASLRMLNHFGQKGVRKELASLSGVIAVSEQNRKMIEAFVDPEMIGVFPNSVDRSLFCPLSKQKCREKLGLDRDAFIVSFVGSFDERKGISHLSEAVEKLSGKVRLIAAGKGNVRPQTRYCLIEKSFPHNQIPVFLNASDAFVLPTRHEGCSNAIVEAVACGLPVISSDRDFNLDILDESNSILVDPDSVEEIKSAIERLMDERLRLQMSENSLKKAGDFDIENRAGKIMDFIRNRIDS